MRWFWAVSALCVVAAAQSLGTLAPRLPTAVPSRRGFAVIQLRATPGMRVREFVGPSGVIFGLAWQGSRVPDLQVFLGAHFARFQQALARQQALRPRRRGPLFIQVGDLVVQNGGHMRAFVGRAYLTDAIPPGLSPQVIH